MSKLYRSEFVTQHRGASLDVDKLREDGQAGRRLEEVGARGDDLSKADLNRDGKISGAAEVGALYDRVDQLDRDGQPGSLVAVDRAGNALPAGKAMSALGLLFENKDTGFSISAPVGPGQRNSRADVTAVQRRLNALGFKLDEDGAWGRNTQNALRTYAAMLDGTENTRDKPGVIRPGDALCELLASSSAPRWVQTPASGPGFKNGDRDGFSHGAETTMNVLRDAGARYHASHLTQNPNDNPITTNDVSARNGGKTRDHGTHQAGLDLDVYLPAKDGSSNVHYNSNAYDRDAAVEMVKSFAMDDRVERVLVKDREIVRRLQATGEPWADKVERASNGHQHHFHVDIKPPPAPAPVTAQR